MTTSMTHTKARPHLYSVFSGRPLTCSALPHAKIHFNDISMLQALRLLHYSIYRLGKPVIILLCICFILMSPKGTCVLLAASIFLCNTAVKATPDFYYVV